MQTRIELQGSINEYISNKRIYLSKAERSAIDWAMVDDHHSVLELSCEHENLLEYYQVQYNIRACGLCFDVELAHQLRDSLEDAEIMSSINGDIPWKSNSFDRIIMTNTLPFYLSLSDFLVEMYRVLKPGGKMVFSLPSLNWHYFLHLLKSEQAVWKQLLLQLEKAEFKEVSCNMTRFFQRSLIAHKL